MSGIKSKMHGGDKIFHTIKSIILILSFLIVAIPLLNVIASSFSSPDAVIRGKVRILPINFNVEAYKQIFQSSMLITGYKNSILYTVVGTFINITMTVMVAYPLSIKDFEGRKVITALFLFTMIFSAPLIPTYLNIRSLHMLDTIWVMVIPGAISTYNMIIAKTYFENSIPQEMVEAAQIDGASDTQILLKLVLPLSKAIIAVLVLYYAVVHWNSYFDAFIYLSSESKLTLQVVLRNIMSSVQALQEMAYTTIAQNERAATIEVLKYAVIVFGSVPIIALYPFVQKYFVKGVMIGSVKG